MIHPVRMWSHVSRSLKFWPISIGMEALRIGIQPDLALVSKKGIHSQHGGFCNFHQGVSEHGGKTPNGYRANDDSQMDSGVFPMFSPIFFKNLGLYLVFSHVFPCFPLFSQLFPLFWRGPVPTGPVTATAPCPTPRSPRKAARDATERAACRGSGSTPGGRRRSDGRDQAARNLGPNKYRQKRWDRYLYIYGKKNT